MLTAESRNNSLMAIGTIKIPVGRQMARILLLHPAGLKIDGGCHVLMCMSCRLKPNRKTETNGRPLRPTNPRMTTRTAQAPYTQSPRLRPSFHTTPVPTEGRKQGNYSV